jgi:hypothetical protein
MCFEPNLFFVGHLAGPSDNGMKATGGDPGFFSHFLNEPRNSILVSDDIRLMRLAKRGSHDRWP